MEINNFKDKLRMKMDEYVHFIYKITKKFPKDELYGVISQIRRASLSIVLNYIEGYARRKPMVQINFFKISYGSLQESKYLVDSSYKEEYIEQKDFDFALILANEIGAMLWTEIFSLEKKYK